MSSKVIVELIAAKATDLLDIELLRKISTYFSRIIGVNEDVKTSTR